MDHYLLFLGKEDIDGLFLSERHKDVECMLHLHRSMEIVLVNEGVLSVEINGCSYSVPAGAAVFVPPYAPHMFHSAQSNCCHVLMFQCDLVEYFSNFLKNNHPGTHLFWPSAESLSLAERLLPHRANRADCLMAQAILSPFFYDIYEKCRFSPKKDAEEDLLIKVLEYMSLHFTERITLASAAKVIGVHPVTLCNQFSRLSKISFSSHLNYLRCSRAASLIRETDLPLTEIAYASGFGSIRSFNRVFHSVYEITPSEFRKRILRST